MFDAVPVIYLPNNFCKIIGAIWWHRQRNWLPNCITCRVAENSLRPIVPIRNNSIPVLADNRVVRRFDNGCKSKPRQRCDLFADVRLSFPHSLFPGFGHVVSSLQKHHVSFKTDAATRAATAAIS
jgi:hypothetical protein